FSVISPNSSRKCSPKSLPSSRGISRSIMAITFALLLYARPLKRGRLLVAGFGCCASTERACTRSRCHYGTAGLVRGGAANDLLTISGEPNVTIMEAKACTCNIVPGRLPRGPAFAEFLNKYAPQTGPTILHPEERSFRKGQSGGGHAHEGKTWMRQIVG